MKISFFGKFYQITSNIADMIIISFLWIVLCIPVVTFIPATVALYYTAAKVIRKDVGKVLSEFFGAFRKNFGQGIVLSILYLLTGVLLGGIYVFCQWRGIGTALGSVYYVFLLVFVIVWTCVTYYLIPVISRFQVSLFGAFRLALYFGARNLGTMIPMIITLIGGVILIYVIPETVLIVPGFYAYLMAKPIEKSFRKYIREELPNPESHEGMWYMEE